MRRVEPRARGFALSSSALTLAAVLTLTSVLCGLTLFAPRSAYGQAQDCASYPTLCKLKVHSEINEPDLGKAVDIVIIGDGFTDMAVYNARAQALIKAFKVDQPQMFQLAPKLYNFHIVEVLSPTTDVNDADTSDTALGMTTGGALITWDSARAMTAALNAPDVDLTLAVANATVGRANALIPTQLLSGGSIRLRQNRFESLTHEMGHALFLLVDEYTSKTSCTQRHESYFYRRPNGSADPSCLRFANTPGAGCVEGSFYCEKGHYRPAQSCLMREAGTTPLCPVCARAVEEMLAEKRTGFDLADPWAVIEQPREGDVLSGSVTVRVRGFDDYFKPVTVVTELDGRLLSAQQVSWLSQKTLDTKTLQNGPHTLVPYAIDAAGHTRAGPPVKVIVDNASPALCSGAGDCDDKDPCTVDSCSAGSCKHAPTAGCCNGGHDCDDNDPCTQNLCVSAVCQNPFAGPGFTLAAACCPPPGCDDGDACTVDRCDALAGCVHEPSSGACDDGDACTIDDRCGAGGCAGTPRDCDDGDPCTQDSCDAQRGCEHVPLPGCGGDGAVGLDRGAAQGDAGPPAPASSGCAVGWRADRGADSRGALGATLLPMLLALLAWARRRP
jgi:hypothetical protein